MKIHTRLFYDFCCQEKLEKSFGTQILCLNYLECILKYITVKLQLLELQSFGSIQGNKNLVQTKL